MQALRNRRKKKMRAWSLEIRAEECESLGCLFLNEADREAVRTVYSGTGTPELREIAEGAIKNAFYELLELMRLDSWEATAGNVEAIKQEITAFFERTMLPPPSDAP
jgi:hypothetical protein